MNSFVVEKINTIITNVFSDAQKIRQLPMQQLQLLPNGNYTFYKEFKEQVNLVGCIIYYSNNRHILQFNYKLDIPKLTHTEIQYIRKMLDECFVEKYNIEIRLFANMSMLKSLCGNWSYEYIIQVFYGGNGFIIPDEC